MCVLKLCGKPEKKVEYLGEFETKIVNILGCLSSPSHADVPLSLNCVFIMLS
jgi:hypothetical protein